MIDKANARFHNWNMGREPNWDEFARGICKIFGDEGLEDIVEGFMKLIQENSVEEYHDEFENMRIRLKRFMPELGESYFLSRFIAGLRMKLD